MPEERMWRHRLDSIDKDAGRGVCRKCGDVPLVYLKKRNRWKCSIAKREQRAGKR